MDKLAAGFWGCFFGTVSLMLGGAGLAYARYVHRVAANAALSALASAFYAAAYLGWLPIAEPQMLARFLAHVATDVSAILAYLLLAMLGLLKTSTGRTRALTGLVGLSGAVLLAGWLVSPRDSLVMSSLVACALALGGLALCVRGALRGERLAWAAGLGVFFMLLAVAGLSWIALHRDETPWQVHALSAVAATAYLATMASVLWARYSYLIELREVMAHGPSYDPVTRMRSHNETGQMVGAAFHRGEGEALRLGVIVVSIGNLYALEKLHGRAAVNHALFVCAGRLRRCAPRHVEMGRLADDGFLLLVKNSNDPQRLIHLARLVNARLSRPVVLSTSRDPEMLEASQTRWIADVGVGVLAASAPNIRAASAVAMARAMSRTAWSYASRVAWYDQAAGQIAELPGRAAEAV